MLSVHPPETDNNKILILLVTLVTSDNKLLEGFYLYEQRGMYPYPLNTEISSLL